MSINLRIYIKCCNFLKAVTYERHVTHSYWAKERETMQMWLLPALASVAQLVGPLSLNQRVASLTPYQGTYLDCGFDPQSGHV